MKDTVFKIDEKKQNKQHMTNPDTRIRLVPYSQAEYEMRVMQEQHHANHALCYFALLTYSLICGINKKYTCEPALRLDLHLTCLSGLIEADDFKLVAAVNHLRNETRRDVPRSKKDWIRFIAGNAGSITVLSQRYGGFDCGELAKMKDLERHRHWLRVWWWRARAKQIVRRANRLISRIRRKGLRDEKSN